VTQEIALMILEPAILGELHGYLRAIMPNNDKLVSIDRLDLSETVFFVSRCRDEVLSTDRNRGWEIIHRVQLLRNARNRYSHRDRIGIITTEEQIGDLLNLKRLLTSMSVDNRQSTTLSGLQDEIDKWIVRLLGNYWDAMTGGPHETEKDNALAETISAKVAAYLETTQGTPTQSAASGEVRDVEMGNSPELESKFLSMEMQLGKFRARTMREN